MSRKKVLNPNLSLSNINDISTIFPDLITGEIIINTNPEKKSLITLDDNSNFIKFIDEEQIDDKISDSLKESKEYADSKVIGLASKEWVENEISQIDLGDLSGFVTEKDIEDMATKSWVEGQNYLIEHQDISGLATKDETSEAATQALENAKADAEAKYQVKGNYEAAGAAAAVKTWVEEQNYLTEHQDISGLATKEDITTVNSRIDEILETGGSGEINVINSISVNGAPLEIINKNVNIEIPDTKDYATIDYVDSKVNGKFEEAGAAAAVKTWVEEQNYLTEHQDISGLATKVEVAEAVSGMATEAWVKEQNYLTEHQDISNLATKGEVAGAVSGMATEAWVDEKIDELSDIYAPKADVKTLVGSDSGKSVRDIAVEEVASIVSGAPEAFDTLVEIANWITSDSAGTEALIGRVAELEGDVEVLSGASHSHENKDVLDGIIADKVTAWDGAQAAAEAYADSLAGNYDEAGAAAAVKTWVEEQNYLTEHQDISGLATKDEVDILVSGDTGKSIRYIALEEVVKVVSGAPESFDTLKEIADWITNDTTGAAKMANDIEALKVISGNPSYVNIQSDWLATATTDASYIKNKPTLSKFTVDGVTGNTIGLLPLTGGTLNEYSIDKVPSATTADKAFKDGDGNNIVNTYATKSSVAQSDWNTTATTDASYIKNKPRITGSTILGVTGNTVSLTNLTTGFSSIANIGDDTVLKSKSNYSNDPLTRSITSGMCIDTTVPDTYLKLANGTKWGTGYNNAILTISRYNTDKYSSQLGFSQNGIYYRGFGGTLPTTSAPWTKVLLSNDSLNADNIFVYTNDSREGKLYLVGTDGAGSDNYRDLYNDSRIYTSGGCLFATSDERLKDFYEDVDCDLDALKSIPKKYFSWKSDDGKGRQVGTSAQELRKLYPEIVSVDEDGTHSVAYDRLSIVALSAIDKLYDTIKELQTKNEELEKRIKDLENK